MSLKSHKIYSGYINHFDMDPEKTQMQKTIQCWCILSFSGICVVLHITLLYAVIVHIRRSQSTLIGRLKVYIYFTIRESFHEFYSTLMGLN